MKKEDVIFINERNAGFNPVHFGYHYVEPGFVTEYTFRPYWVIHYVFSGCGRLYTNDKYYDVESGEMFMLPPYEYAGYQADTKTPWNYIWIAFEDNLNQLPEAFHVPTLRVPGAGIIFNEMLQCQKMDKGKGAFLISQLWKLISCVLERTADAPKTDYVATGILIMETEYMHDISIEEVARRLNIARHYFSFIFKKQMGITPIQYLNNFRLEKAAEFMTKYNQTPTAAATAVGYTDMSHFSKSFKQKYGKSPRNYVKEIRK